jgi:uncharacterized membrane protein
MSFIKQHKYAFISSLVYLLPALLLLGPHGGWFPQILFRIFLLSTFNQLRAVLAFMLASYIIGIVFAVQSIRHKEPKWAEISMLITGILALILNFSFLGVVWQVALFGYK